MRKIRFAVLAIAVALVGAQFVQPSRINPPADPRNSFAEVARPPHQVAAVLERSCGDCHSQNTVWPWYSKIAPVSWLIASDVNEARAVLNLSRWDVYSQEMSKLRAQTMCKAVKSGDMPPWYYRPMHPGTGLSQDEIAAICAL